MKFTDHPELYAWVLAILGLVSIVTLVLTNHAVPDQLYTFEGLFVGGALGVTVPGVVAGNVSASAGSPPTGQVAGANPAAVDGPTS